MASPSIPRLRVVLGPDMGCSTAICFCPFLGTLEIGFHVGFYDTEDDSSIYNGYDLGVNASKNGFTFGVNKHENTNTSVYVSYAVDLDL